MSERGRSPASPRPGAPTMSLPYRPSASRSGSPVKTGGAPSGWVAGPGYDPAKPAVQPEKGNTRMELPPDAYISDAKKDIFALRGNRFNTEGSKAVVEVNQYRMKKFDFTKKIVQYDVVTSPDAASKPALMKKIWANSATKAALQKYTYQMWIFDGRKLAWAPGRVDRGELRFTVNLDEGKHPSNAPVRDSASFYVTLRATTEVQISALKGYLERAMEFNNAVQEALNFMDHLLRQWPSQHMTAIKRNFYSNSDPGRPLVDGRVLKVHKGTYTSIRMSHNLNFGGIGLALNADVANTVFWVGSQPMEQLLCYYLRMSHRRWENLDPSTMADALRPVRDQKRGWQQSDAFKLARQIRKLKFTVKHANRPAALSDKVYTVIDVVFDPKYGQDGATAKTVTFEMEGGKTISVANYFQHQYKAPLRYGNLPLILAGKGTYIPMEFAIVQPMQRYLSKLTPTQTAAMIKIAVTRPQQRRADIERGVAGLQFSSDPFLKAYGVEFEPSFTKTEARVLAPPAVNFAQGTADPKFSGRWDLRGKKFWKANVAPLVNWGFVVMDNCVQYPQLSAFAKSFRQTFLGHGGNSPAEALLLNVPGTISNDPCKVVAWAHGEIIKQRGYPQLLFVVVRAKGSEHYNRLKKSADCRFGILSQVINAGAVRDNNGQYHSNVCMKVNAKLGGTTSRTVPPWKSSPTYFPRDRPTMVIGLDISHGSPGSGAPSTAAMTMSVDRDANRFAAMVETNGYRVEMLTPANVHAMFGQLTRYWMAGHENAFPKHIIYLRDGVAEGQFAQVLDKEILEIKRYLAEKAPKAAMPKFTVMVATKRHHIRIFPQKGDRNGNPLPGTLVEREVTHPFMWDFYLSSHVAIQGTARPVHYHILVDEMGVPVNELQKMIYHQCYSYARSTTPVSIHPAIYYAHLAGARARNHEDVSMSDAGSVNSRGQSGGPAPPLLPLGGKPEQAPIDGEMRQRGFIRGTMWYI